MPALRRPSYKRESQVLLLLDLLWDSQLRAARPAAVVMPEFPSWSRQGPYLHAGVSAGVGQQSTQILLFPSGGDIPHQVDADERYPTRSNGALDWLAALSPPSSALSETGSLRVACPPSSSSALVSSSSRSRSTIRQPSSSPRRGEPPASALRRPLSLLECGTFTTAASSSGCHVPTWCRSSRPASTGTRSSPSHRQVRNAGAGVVASHSRLNARRCTTRPFFVPICPRVPRGKCRGCCGLLSIHAGVEMRLVSSSRT